MSRTTNTTAADTAANSAAETPTPEATVPAESTPPMTEMNKLKFTSIEAAQPLALLPSSEPRAVVMATLIAGLLRFGKLPRNVEEAQYYVDLVTPTTDAIIAASTDN